MEDIAQDFPSFAHILFDVKVALSTEWINEAQMLCQILGNPELQAILEACDEIAYGRRAATQCEATRSESRDDEYNFSQYSCDFNTFDGTQDDENEDDFGNFKLVTIIKGQEPLGATITFEEQSGAIVISRVMFGGAAHRSGLVQIGDVICEVNGLWLPGRSHIDIVHYLERECRKGMIYFKLLASAEDKAGMNHHNTCGTFTVKAHFDYNPATDSDHPCVEAGLVFKDGDILEIVDQLEDTWWQARHEGDEMTRAGLIPSTEFHKRRLLAQSDLRGNCTKTLVILPSTKTKGKFRKAFSTQKLRKVTYQMTQPMHKLAMDCIFEPVLMMPPTRGIHRPLVLVGAARVGKKKLMRRLLAIDPELYKQPLAHTSRDSLGYEVDGCEYLFVSREWMQREISQRRFLEHREHRGHLYGIHENTVIELIRTGAIAVFTLQPHSLKLVRSCGHLRPFIAFIKPPPHLTDCLKDQSQSFSFCTGQHFRHAKGKRNSALTDDQLIKLVIESHKIEYLCGQYFDMKLVNEDMDDPLGHIVAALKSLQTEPQWVAASWLTQ